MAFFSIRSSDEMGWTMVAASSLACSFGASIVFLDQCTDRFPILKGFNIEGSPHFLAASLSLASGVMLFSALFNLLPEAVSDLQKATPGFRDHAPQIAMALYFLGVAFTLLVNLGVRLLTPGVSCPCEPIETGGILPVGEREGAKRGHDHSQSHGHDLGTCSGVNGSGTHRSMEQEDGERSRLLRAKASRAAAKEAKETARLVQEAHAATSTTESPPHPGSDEENEPDGRNGNADSSERLFVDTTATLPGMQRRSSAVTFHCQGLYEDHAFLHHHTHASHLAAAATTNLRIDTAEPSLSSKCQTCPPAVGAQKYGTFSPNESSGKGPSKSISHQAPSALPHLHHQSHHHHPHHHHYPYQNVTYNCSSNTSLDMHHAQQQQHHQPLKSPTHNGTLDEAPYQNEGLIGHQANEHHNYFSPRSRSAGPASHASFTSSHDHHRLHMHDCDANSDASSNCSINSSTNVCHEAEQKDRHELLRIGVQTAVAISLHKFPEGLITFVGAKASPAMGFSVFLAIFIHNIPEGLMIAVPLLVATSSRLKAFLLASLLGGLSQPLGALLGYFLLPSRPPVNTLPSPAHEHPDDGPYVNTIYGTLFAFVAGLMTCVVVQGMFPAAVRFDPKGKIVTIGFFAGVALVGGSWAILGKTE